MTNTIGQREKLEACPFCGADLVESENLATRTARLFVHVRNDDAPCPADGVLIWSNRPERIAAWNRRAHPPSPGVEKTGEREAAIALLTKRCAEIDAHYARYPNTTDRSMAETAAAIRTILALSPTSGGGTGWQTIDSAPRDGKVILLGHAHAAFDGWWDANFEAWIDGSLDGAGDMVLYPATHWMHLPELPAAPSSPEDIGGLE